jgi:hypothetical protein
MICEKTTPVQKEQPIGSHGKCSMPVDQEFYIDDIDIFSLVRVCAWRRHQFREFSVELDICTMTFAEQTELYNSSLRIAKVIDAAIAIDSDPNTEVGKVISDFQAFLLPWRNDISTVLRRLVANGAG